jgi:hypothetical protein
MDAESIAGWMYIKLEKDGCVYQDDVVDYLVKSKGENFLRENSAGNLVLGRKVLDTFKRLTEINVVWVKPERYWRFRVAQDEIGRDARG